VIDIQILKALERGDTLARPFALENDWVVADFTGGIWFTVRAQPPALNELDDANAIGQVSVAGGGIVFSTTTEGVVTIAASVTNGWEPGNKYWDLQGVITGPPQRVYTLARGRIAIVGDITRRTT
jgi:hypothetical protein